MTQELATSAVETLPLVIGGCRRISELGRGGMGTVYRALQLSMDREVALKVIHPVHASNPVSCERFVREIRCAGAVSCAHLVSCHDAGNDANILYLVMELIGGGDVGQLIRAQGPLGPSQAVQVLRDAASGVRALHQAGLLHRDIKPSNIFLTNTGSAKLADLGLARRMGDDQSLTNTGALIGTPAFMSPEQALGEEIDERSDIYALGATLYAALTGKAPYEGSSVLAIAKQVLDGPFPDPRKTLPRIPSGLAAVVMRACAKDRAARPANAAAFIDELDRAARRQSNVLPPAPTVATVRPLPILRRRPPPRSTRRWLAWGGAAIAVIAVVGVAIAVNRRPAVAQVPPPVEAQPARVAQADPPPQVAPQPRAAPRPAPRHPPRRPRRPPRHRASRPPQRSRPRQSFPSPVALRRSPPLPPHRPHCRSIDASWTPSCTSPAAGTRRSSACTSSPRPRRSPPSPRKNVARTSSPSAWLAATR